MARLAFYPLLLPLILQHGICTQGKIRVETLPSDVGQVSCTGNLLCEASDMWCMPGDLKEADCPVLVPTDIRTKTVKKCGRTGCSLCLQVIMDISVAFISGVDEFGSGDCDYDDYYEDHEGEEEDEDDEDHTTAVNLYLRVNNSNNGSFICANLFVSPSTPSFSCHMVKVSLPLSTVPPRINTSSVNVGSLVYSCINANPGTEITITSYTVPRYFKELSVSHDFPGCTDLDPKEDISECEAPTLNLNTTGVKKSIGITDGTFNRNTTLRVFYQARHIRNDTTQILNGNQRYNFPESDIVPCLCFQAWYCDRIDAVRTSFCPFMKVSDAEERIHNKSDLSMEIINNRVLYKLSAPCNLSAEMSLCWKFSKDSECREFPYSRKKIVSEQTETIEFLHRLHPSVCLQVSVKGKVLHTKCLPVNGTHEKREEAIVLVSKHDPLNISVCQVKTNGCTILYNTTHQMREGSEFLEKMIMKDIKSDQCMKIWNISEIHHIYVCTLDKYMRSRWNWPTVLCLLLVAGVLLTLLLKNEHFKKWLKSVTDEKPLGEIFKYRRVLILYSPDNPVYEALVRDFASSLEELKLNVVLDQWNRQEMSEVNPLPWYHRQKSLVFKNNGLVILLFSEGAQERYNAWMEQRPQHLMDLDPYRSFGAVLNCVHSDFRDGTAKGRYLVACFDFYSRGVIPKLFNSVPVYMLPLNLVQLLRELAGDTANKLGRKQVNRLSDKIKDGLQTQMNQCQQRAYRQTGISQVSSDTSASSIADGSVAVEIQPLM